MLSKKLVISRVQLTIVLILVSCASQSSSFELGDVNVNIRLCEQEHCFLRDNTTYTGVKYNRQLLKLISSGIPQLLWEDISNLIAKTPQVSLRCHRRLLETSDALQDQQEWAYRIIDSSAKFEKAFLEGSVTSLGDYDECLRVRSPRSNFEGKYCMVDVFPLRPKDEDNHGQARLGDNTVFRFTPYLMGLCFPHTCTNRDVRHLVAKVLEDYPVSVTGAISCDTATSVSYSTRFQNLRTGQIVAIGFLLTVASLLTLAAFSDFLDLTKSGIKLPFDANAEAIVNSFSPLRNIQKLFEVKASSRLDFVDWFKLAVVVTGAFAHCMICLETPLGFFMIGRHSKFNEIFTSASTQFLMNDGGLGWVTFLSGFAAVHALLPFIQDNRLSFRRAIYDKWTRYAPCVAAIMALDFVWPLLGSGPFHTRVSSFVLNKCSRNWWSNLAFVSSFYSLLDICATQTYYLSIDFQLFLLGLVVMYSLAKAPRFGVTLGFSGIAFGMSMLYYNAYTYKTYPTVAIKNSHPQKIVEFMDRIQAAPFVYISNYLSGVMAAYFLKNGFRLKLEKRSDHIFWCTLAYLSLSAAQIGPILCNTLNIIPDYLIPAYLVANRGAFSMTVIILVIYLSSLTEIQNEKGKKSVGAKQDKIEAEVAKEQLKLNECHSTSNDGFDWSLMKTAIGNFFASAPARALTRLSFAIYIANYFFIRTDFFTARHAFPSDWFSISKRQAASMVFVVMTSFLFHMTFVAPFDNLRRLLKINYITPKIGVDGQHDRESIINEKGA